VTADAELEVPDDALVDDIATEIRVEDVGAASDLEIGTGQ
jgi:hypothetical protein